MNDRWNGKRNKTLYQAKHWFRQYRGLEPIRPSRITLPEPVTRANDTEIELVAVCLLKAGVHRSLIYPIREIYKDFREVQELDYNAGRWRCQAGGMQLNPLA